MDKKIFRINSIHENENNEKIKDYEELKELYENWKKKDLEGMIKSLGLDSFLKLGGVNLSEDAKKELFVSWFLGKMYKKIEEISKGDVSFLEEIESIKSEALREGIKEFIKNNPFDKNFVGFKSIILVPYESKYNKGEINYQEYIKSDKFPFVERDYSSRFKDGFDLPSSKKISIGNNEINIESIVLGPRQNILKMIFAPYINLKEIFSETTDITESEKKDLFNALSEVETDSKLIGKKIGNIFEIIYSGYKCLQEAESYLDKAIYLVINGELKIGDTVSDIKEIKLKDGNLENLVIEIPSKGILETKGFEIDSKNTHTEVRIELRFKIKEERRIREREIHNNFYKRSDLYSQYDPGKITRGINISKEDFFSSQGSDYYIGDNKTSYYYDIDSFKEYISKSLNNYMNELKYKKAKLETLHVELENLKKEGNIKQIVNFFLSKLKINLKKDKDDKNKLIEHIENQIKRINNEIKKLEEEIEKIKKKKESLDKLLTIEKININFLFVPFDFHPEK